jgi:hypothetical protein
MTLSISEITQYRMMGPLLNTELENMLQQAKWRNLTYDPNICWGN